MSKEYNWHKIAESVAEIKFSPNGLLEVQVANKTVCLAFKDGQLASCVQKCPHAGALMAEGYTDALGNIVCPHHRYKFSLKNGRNVSGEGYFLKIFPVEVRNDGVFIGFEEKGLLR